MSLRCNPGDMAVIVDARHDDLRHLIGTVLTVKKIVTRDSFGELCWSYKGPRLRACGLVCDAVPDIWLRPIRDNPGTDEMLRITGKPHETPIEVLRHLTERVG